MVTLSRGVELASVCRERLPVPSVYPSVGSCFFLDSRRAWTAGQCVMLMFGLSRRSK